MTKIWAILSDVHGRGDRLKRVLADAEAHGASQVLALGDIGDVPALNTLDRAGATCVFGNWEASGLRGLPPLYRGWVGRWPPAFRADGLWAAHASPVWPEGLGIAGVVDYLRERQWHWTALFPFTSAFRTGALGCAGRTRNCGRAESSSTAIRTPRRRGVGSRAACRST